MKKILLILVLPIIFNSCIKKQVVSNNYECVDSCSTLKGRILNEQLNAGIEVYIEVVENTGSILSFDHNIGLIHSQPDGFFITKVTKYNSLYNLKFYLMSTSGIVAQVYPINKNADSLIFKF